MNHDGDLIGDGDFVILEPEAWVGHRFPLLPYVEVDAQLDEGDWLVVIYQHTCGHCVETLPKIEAAAQRRLDTIGRAAVVLIEMPPHASPEADPVKPQTVCTRARLTNEREWFAQTPIILNLSAGRVVSIQQELEPSSPFGSRLDE